MGLFEMVFVPISLILMSHFTYALVLNSNCNALLICSEPVLIPANPQSKL